MKTVRCTHTKWHVRPAHVLTGETPVPQDRYGSRLRSRAARNRDRNAGIQLGLFLVVFAVFCTKYGKQGVSIRLNSTIRTGSW